MVIPALSFEVSPYLRRGVAAVTAPVGDGAACGPAGVVVFPLRGGGLPGDRLRAHAREALARGGVLRLSPGDADTLRAVCALGVDP